MNHPIPRLVTLYVALSLDGCIAGPNDELDWLPVPNADNDFGYAEFLRTIDTCLMGRRTFDVVEAMNEPALNPGTTNYVFTSRPSTSRYDNVRFVADDPVEFVKNLKQREGRGIWLEGGGALARPLLEAGLVDELRLFFIPVLLGDGIPLFQRRSAPQAWILRETKVHPGGVVEVRYSLAQSSSSNP
jgi:dihydrofolate reductase